MLRPGKLLPLKALEPQAKSTPVKIDDLHVRSSLITKYKQRRALKIQAHFFLDDHTKPIDAFSHVHRLPMNVKRIKIRYRPHQLFKTPNTNSANHLGSGKLRTEGFNFDGSADSGLWMQEQIASCSCKTLWGLDCSAGSTQQRGQKIPRLSIRGPAKYQRLLDFELHPLFP